MITSLQTSESFHSLRASQSLSFSSPPVTSLSPLQMPHQRRDSASTTVLFIFGWVLPFQHCFFFFLSPLLPFYLIRGGLIIFPKLKVGQIVCGSRWLLVDKGASVNGGYNWGIINNSILCVFSSSCLCPSSLDVVQWPRRCSAKGLSGSPWPSMWVSLWESWWPSSLQGECQVKDTPHFIRTGLPLTVIAMPKHPLLISFFVGCILQVGFCNYQLISLSLKYGSNDCLVNLCQRCSVYTDNKQRQADNMCSYWHNVAE